MCKQYVLRKLHRFMVRCAVITVLSGLLWLGSQPWQLQHVRADSPWTQLGADIDGESEDEWSGKSVSLNAAGTRVAIGAPYNDGNGDYAGHVRVYEWSDGSWQQLGADIDGEAAGDWSGWAVSLNAAGTRVAIGAPDNCGNGSDAGHVRVYEWNDSSESWQQLGADMDGEAANDYSGYSVSLNADGMRVAIGSPGNDGNGSDAGHVRVYEWNDTSESWQQLGADIEGNASLDGSGGAISLNAAGTRVAIGAYGDDNPTGHVRVYEWNDTSASWQQLGVNIDGEAEGDQSGYTVSFDAAGTRMAIGSPYNSGNGVSSGHVRVYEWNDTSESWGQLGADIDGEAEGDLSGWSVSLNATGTRVAIGAICNAGNGSEAGHVRVYEWNDTSASWRQLGADMDGEAEYDNSGHAVSLNTAGTRVAIGANWNNSNGIYAGHVRVYTLFPDLVISKTVALTSVLPGDAITYTLMFSNTGRAIATGVVITDSIPVSVTNTRVISSGPAITGTGTSPAYVWNVADLDAGEGGFITITGVLAVPLAMGTFTNTATITTTAMDSNPGNNSADVGLTVQNAAPVATAGHNQSGDPGASITLDGSGSSDANGDALSYQWQQMGGASVTLNNSAATSPTFTVPSASGMLTFTLMVTDSQGVADATPDEVVITINNVAPVAAAGTTTTNEDTPVSGDLNASDANGDALTYGIFTAPCSGTVTITDTTTGGFLYTPTQDLNGVDSFVFVVTGTGNLTGTATFTVTINGVNDAPSFTKGADELVSVDAGPQTVIGWATGISAGATNEVGQALTFNVTGNSNPDLFAAAPALDSTSGNLTYTPATGVTGTAKITLTLRDDGGTANGGVDTSTPQSFNITVSDKPRYTLTIQTAGTGSGAVTKTPDQSTYTAGTVVTLTAMPDAGSTFTSWNGAGLSGNTSPVTLTIPAADILVTATFTQDAVNVPPTISDILNQATEVSTPSTVTFSISDTDNPVDELWVYAESSNLALVNSHLNGTLMMGGGMNIDCVATLCTLWMTPTIGITGTAIITVTVDDSLATDSESFMLTVAAAPVTDFYIFLPLVQRN